MRPLERSPERDAALLAMLPQVGDLGWTTPALRAGLTACGADPNAADWLFTGTPDMVEAYLDLADRRMAAPARPEPSLSKRVRALILLRLEQAEPERAAVRRAAGVLSAPTNAAAALRTLSRTLDAIWRTAGDRSSDMSWYTKRLSLGAVYTATLLFWLNAPPDDLPATAAFLDRRLRALGAIGRLRARLTPGAGPTPQTAGPG